jgi:hypothetical protein
MASPALVDVQITYDKSPQSELAQRVPELSDDLVTCQVTDQASLNRANALIQSCNEWLKAVDRIMDPVREATHRAWKMSIAAQEEFKQPVERPLKILKAAASKFIADAQAEAQRKQREAEEEQRRLNEAEARRTAKVLKDMGASKDQIQEVRQEIRATPAPVIQPKAEVAQGMSVRTLYSVEIVDMKAFIAHLAHDQYLLTLFGYSAALKKALESELRGEGTKRKDSYSIPGTRLIKTASGAWR